VDVTTDIHAQPTMLWFTVKQIASKYIIQLSGYTTSKKGCQCFFLMELGPDPSSTLSEAHNGLSLGQQQHNTAAFNSISKIPKAENKL